MMCFAASGVTELAQRKTVSVQIYNRVPAFNTHFSKWLVVPNYKFANPGATML